MKKGMALGIIFILLASCANTQEFTKAKWYMTKKQVIQLEGIPDEDDESYYSHALYKNKKKFLGKFVNMDFNFKDRMLNRIDISSDELIWNDVMDYLLETYGKPVIYKNALFQENEHIWEIENSIIVLYSENISRNFFLSTIAFSCYAPGEYTY